jgi:hypothetical protein
MLVELRDLIAELSTMLQPVSVMNAAISIVRGWQQMQISSSGWVSCE